MSGELLGPLGREALDAIDELAPLRDDVATFRAKAARVLFDLTEARLCLVAFRDGDGELEVQPYVDGELSEPARAELQTQVLRLFGDGARVTAEAAAPGDVVERLPAHPVLVCGDVDGPRALVAWRDEPSEEKVLAALRPLARALLAEIDAARLAEKVRRLAAVDPLTGLYNLRQFYRLLAAEEHAARRSDVPLGLVLIDLDGMREVNDLHGRHVGDQALQQVAQRVLAASRKDEPCARFGGDEFAVIVPSASRTTLRAVATRLRDALAPTTVYTSAGQFRVTVSVGAAAVPIELDTVAPKLVRRAAEALAEAQRKQPAGLAVHFS